MHRAPAPTVIKIMMVGTGGVGKSALTLQFMYDEFVEDYEPTKADSYRKKIVIDGEEVQIDILDTAGQEEYCGIHELCFRSVDSFLLVCAINDRETLDAIPAYIEQIIRSRSPDKCSMYLVANKIDLKDASNAHMTKAGMELAQRYGIPYEETSAKTRWNVDNIFQKPARDILQHQVVSNERNKSQMKKKRKKFCSLL